LALFRLYETNQSDDKLKKKADEAMQLSLRRFPTVIGQLLSQNEVDTTSRSTQIDWPSVLDFVNDLVSQFHNSHSTNSSYAPVIYSCTSRAYENIVKIFVQQNHKLFSAWAVLKWVYDNLATLKDRNYQETPTPLSPAIMRYVRCHPTDFEDKFQTMPAEANPLDPSVVAHALHVDPNRPRFMQRMPRAGAFHGGVHEEDFAALAARGGFAGPPTQNIDPDLPLLEVFWRSALPWNVRIN
jgi:hypothetical protein